MKWLKILRDNAREYRQVKNDLSLAEWRLTSVSEVYKALEDPDAYDLFIGANTSATFVCNLKPSIAKKIRGVILEDLENTINAELKYIKELEVKL